MAVCPCKNLGTCVLDVSGNTTSCNCPIGYYDALCSTLWKDYDIVAWNGVQWSLSAVFIVASFICAFQFPQYWWNEDPAFPRMRKAMWAMAFNLVSLILSALVYAVDPYRFNASTGGYLTLGYRAGMSVISNLSQSFVGCAYAVLSASWLSSLTAGVKWDIEVWTTNAVVYFWVICSALIALAGVFAALSIVLTSFTADLIFFACLGVVALIAAFLVGFGSIVVIRNLKTFQNKNSAVRRRVALHALTVSLVLLAITIMIVIVNVVAVNNSFEAFLYVRTLFAGLLSLALRVVLMVHYRYRHKRSDSTSGSQTQQKNSRSPSTSGRLQEDDERIDSPRTGVLEI